MSNPDHDVLLAVAGDGVARALTARPLFVDLSAEVRAFDPASGDLTIAFTAADRHRQGHGVVAGGVIGTMLDFALSLPVLGVLPPLTPFATACYSVNLLAALKPGPVVAEGRIDRRGARIAFTTARLFAEGGDRRLIATGTSTLLISASP